MPSLTEIRKWRVNHRNLAPGNVVLVVDENSPRGEWPVGRITEVFPGPDGVVRSARVKTRRGEYVRPVMKLCLLEENEANYDAYGVFVPENGPRDVPDGNVGHPTANT